MSKSEVSSKQASDLPYIDTRFSFVMATMFFLLAQTLAVFILVLRRRDLHEFHVLVYFVTLGIPLPWLSGLLARWQTKKQLVKAGVAERLQSWVAHSLMNMAVPAYIVLIPTLLLLLIALRS